MLFLILAGIFTGLFVILILLHVAFEYRFDMDWVGGTLPFLFVPIILCIALSFIVSSCMWVLQIKDMEKITKIEEVKVIYQTKAEALTEEFASYLAEIYPEHEKEIFRNISPENVSLYAVKYPEIRSMEGMVALIDRINSLWSDVYEQDILLAETRMEIRVRPKNPAGLRFMIPEAPQLAAP